ncbi:GntR family transcriptional regulator [Treponema pectinovorum]|uniref:GntR family transcriptional regulator n=1 Tax=Treponema pectinovorum TaxID=164 RepID=UPI0011CAB298|nr:GntR family transcriptional regulator [Treponema pectinovorum]
MKKLEVSVYEILRNQIINLEYKPGQELNVNALVEKLGVSRSPVRDALLRLSLDNLVDIFPQKGTRVSLLDVKIIQQERFMRINLELGVLKQFMKSLDETKQKVCGTKLQAILLQQHASLMDSNRKDFLQYDDEMHHFFYEQSGNEWIWNVICNHTGNDHRIRMLSYNAHHIADNVEEEHKALVNAVMAGDFEKALEIDEAHLQKLTEVFEPLMKNFPEYFCE